MILQISSPKALSLFLFITASMSQTLSTAVPISSATGVPTYRNWTYDIPPAEASALAAIVEDVPPVINPVTKRSEGDLIQDKVPIVKRKDNLSPTYSLTYRNPLPIPPVKEPLK